LQYDRFAKQWAKEHGLERSEKEERWLKVGTSTPDRFIQSDP